MRILIFGAGGQVGSALTHRFASVGEVTALTRASTAHCGDLMDAAGIARSIRLLAPDLIVNAAAYTAVDRAEREPGIARAVNAAAPAAMALAARDIGALLIHYSTDYVFDGSGTRLWREGDLPAPLNVYGATKLAGDEAISASGCRHVILRTSWVYSGSGRNFPIAILERARDQDVLTVVDDQVGAPAAADLLAEVTVRVARTARAHDASLDGVYHVAPAGEVSWYNYARFVVDCARRAGAQLSVQEIRPIASSQLNVEAQRPKNSRLDTTKVRTTFGVELPRWERDVERIVSELIRKASVDAA